MSELDGALENSNLNYSFLYLELEPREVLPLDRDHTAARHGCYHHSEG